MTHDDPVALEECIETPAHLPILKKTGAVLLAVGVIDIGWMIYCIRHSMSYSSSFNILAVIAGLNLLGGGLRTASVVRWIAVLTLSIYAATLATLPFIQPLDLSLTQLRLVPTAFVTPVIFSVLTAALSAWLAVELGKPAVLAAREAAGRRRRNMKIPMALGAGGMVALLVAMLFTLNSKSADKAIALAEQQTGPGYRYTVRAINFSSHSVSAIVTAWNDEKIVNLPISWKEP